jgi:hypothetical protein
MNESLWLGLMIVLAYVLYRVASKYLGVATA